MGEERGGEERGSEERGGEERGGEERGGEERGGEERGGKERGGEEVYKRLTLLSFTQIENVILYPGYRTGDPSTPWTTGYSSQALL